MTLQGVKVNFVRFFIMANFLSSRCSDCALGCKAGGEFDKFTMLIKSINRSFYQTCTVCLSVYKTYTYLYINQYLS